MKASPFLYLLPIGVAFVYTSAEAQTKQPKTATSTTTTSSSSASPEGQYRQSSSANGTAVNNSNSTNYNSNNVTNAPTGVGSNPSVLADSTAINGASSSGSSSNTASSSGTNESAKTGTAAAVTGAQKAPTPAIVAGSTTRNSSIHDYIASSPNYTTLQNALQSAQLYNSLKEGGPYTLFAPSNSAFKKLPAAMQAGLLEGRNQDKLKQLLVYHLVEGQLDEEELTKRIKAKGGKAQLQTRSGGSLLAQINSRGQLTLTDESGQTATVEAADKQQSNGMVHGINAVLLPKGVANTIR